MKLAKKRSAKENVNITNEFYIFERPLVPNFSLIRQLFCKEADRHNGNLTSLIILVAETIKVICEDIVKKDFRNSYREKSCGGYSGEFAKFAGGHL